MYDTVIIGKGPAGISAAIYLKRAGLNVLVIGKDGGSLENAGMIENYYGFEEALGGKELVSAGIKQAENLGIEVISDEITGADFFDGINVKTLSAIYKAKTLLFALGKKKKTLNIKGVQEFSGNGVSYCAVCDGFFYKGKKAAVIGGGKLAISEAEYLMLIAKEVILFSNGELLPRYTNPFTVIEDKIIEIYGDDRVKGIKTEKNDYSVDGVFIAAGSAGTEDFALKMGLETNNGNIVVDNQYATNIEGIYAAGDCIGGFLQVSKAVADGAKAAKSIISFLKNQKN